MSQDRPVEPPEAERSFQVLLEALRHKDEDAWKTVTRRYTERLIWKARQRLDSRLRPKLSGEDVVQSVFRTFLRRHKEKPFALESWDQLWGLLVTLTVRKCYYWWDYYAAQRRDLTREVPLQPAARDSSAAEGGPGPADRDPTPAEAALLVEMVEETLRGLTARERDIVQRGLLGDPDREIAAQVGRTEYMVAQLRTRYAALLQDQHDRAATPGGSPAAAGPSPESAQP
jgi:DNA-binding CsgD family transcriptional regulator